MKKHKELDGYIWDKLGYRLLNQLRDQVGEYVDDEVGERLRNPLLYHFVNHPLSLLREQLKDCDYYEET